MYCQSRSYPARSLFTSVSLENDEACEPCLTHRSFSVPFPSDFFRCHVSILTFLWTAFCINSVFVIIERQFLFLPSHLSSNHSTSHSMTVTPAKNMDEKSLSLASLASSLALIANCLYHFYPILFDLTWHAQLWIV
jgi:hypothetical protein